MKYKLLSIVLALSAATTAAQVITLDLTHPTSPQSIEIDQNRWTGTYSDKLKSLEFGLFAFSHSLGGSWGGTYWDGFTVAAGLDKSNHLYDDGGWTAHQWFNIAGGGIRCDVDGNPVTDADGNIESDPDAPYLLGYWGWFAGSPQPCQVSFTDGARHRPVSVYITNSTWPYYGNIEGDGFAKPLAENGYFALIANGLDDDGQVVSTVRINLATNDGELQQIDRWTYFDLSDLGSVSGLYFSLESSDNSEFGMNTAPFFCIDRLSVEAIPSVVNDLGPEGKKQSVRYLSTSGLESDEPFDGINIVVTTFSDGSVKTSKHITKNR
ncbi:MAG: DUF4465 domain-containing protein [Bacteroidales bacterium]|nr:DUF4465 domain-containing protein [Candidatus Sodaliphilus aphodohippi]